MTLHVGRLYMHPADADVAIARDVRAQSTAEHERHIALLARCAQALEWYAEYLNEAPIWHCTGHEANTVNPLLRDVREALKAAR